MKFPKLSNNPSKSVKLAAIVAMRRIASPEIRAFLKDDDELILLEAARAIHDDQSIPRRYQISLLFSTVKGLKTKPLSEEHSTQH